MQTIIDIEGRIVSTELLMERFCCDLSLCKGICCVEGNAGAPLGDDELDLLEQEYGAYEKYMTPEGRAAIEEQGFFVVDLDGDYTTPLVDEAECAYSVTEEGITFCAIEKASREGKTGFKKPISCHLYPIRVTKFSDNSEGLNYHKWDVCQSACDCGVRLGIPVYKTLKEPIILRFGESFYEAMDLAAEHIKE